MGVDGQFEGLERSGLNNGFGQVIPKGGSVWVKGRLWKRQTAKRGVNSTGIKVTQTGTGMGSVGVGRWAQAMEDFEQVTKSGNFKYSKPKVKSFKMIKLEYNLPSMARVVIKDFDMKIETIIR